MAADKLQKLLASQGLGSRREIERWIAAGRITVNGRLAQLGDRASVNDKIVVDGRVVKFTKQAKSNTRLLVYNKPEGQVCTRNDPEGRPTVFNHLPMLKSGRWVSIGRLDINTSGLLLFTNDGDLANRLMHPRYAIEREYAVRVLGNVTKAICEQLLQGVKLDDGVAKFSAIEFKGGRGANRWYHVLLAEGRKREVRRLWESQGVKVSRLIRVRYGSILLPRDLSQGHWQELTADDIKQLINQ